MKTRSGLSVLLVGNFLSGAGGRRSICEELASRLPVLGCRVVTTSSSQRRLGRLVDMVATAWRRRNDYVVAQVDVFSGLAFFWAEAVCAALNVAGKPYILSLHGGNLPAFARKHPTRVRRLLQSAAAVTTPSKYLIENLGWCRDDIRFIPNGLDLDAYVPRRRVSVAPQVIWIRAFHHAYNPALAIRTLANLLPRFPTMHLTMVGPDKGDGSLQATERLAIELGVANHVAFVGGIPKNEVPLALAAADIFLNTTNVDNAPVTVIEAMAAGLSVVSTNVGGVPHLVADGRDALLVPPNDPAAMAAAVTRILVEPGLADGLVKAARKKVEQLDWSPIVSEWRALLEDTAEHVA